VVGASISGTVKDESGAGIAAAAVSVKSLETGAERKLIADDAGRYSAPSIAIGRYQVSAEKPGFTSQLKTGIDLVVGQNAVVDLTLPVGEIKQVITVEAAASPVNQSTQQISGLVDERQIKDLPLNGRSYDQLVTLNPGIVNYTYERSGGVGTSSSSVGNMFAVSGRRPQENLFLLNGVEFTGASVINNTPGGTSGELLGVDAVREFNVVTDTYGAEYGKRPGAQVSIVTASGTTACTARSTNSCATAIWTRAISSTRARFRNFSATASAARWAAPSRRTSCSCSAITKASGSTWASAT
jgi:hypothetical protein